jgi:phosphoglycolate phosphatase
MRRGAYRACWRVVLSRRKVCEEYGALFPLRCNAPFLFLRFVQTVIPPFPVYLFDVDGTLLHSEPDICGAIQEVLQANGRSDVPAEFLRGYIGRHLLDVFLDVGFERGAIDAMIAHYRAVYLARKHAATTIYPGVAEMLALLGGRKSTATTKGTPTTHAILEQFGLLTHFDHVQGTDGFPAKPEPDVILTALAALGARPEECLFVGDSAADMEAGRKAGVQRCAVRWGYGDVEEMARWEPEYWIDRPEELSALHR